MVILKKIKASTLMETLVATVIIITVFMMAMLIINQILKTTIKKDTTNIESKLNELEYFIINDKVKIPYSETYNVWEIRITKNKEHDYFLDAINQVTNQTISSSFEIKH